MPALSIALALALAGCDSNDDDGDGAGEGEGASDGGDPPTQPGGESETAGTFADVIARGAGDEPLALDAAALGADLDDRFGSVNDEPVDVGDDDTVETAVRGGSRR